MHHIAGKVCAHSCGVARRKGCAVEGGAFCFLSCALVKLRENQETNVDRVCTVLLARYALMWCKERRGCGAVEGGGLYFRPGDTKEALARVGVYE